MKITNKQFSSWSSSIPEFSDILQELRLSPPIEDASHHCINSNHGKSVWHCKINGFDFAYKIQDAHPKSRYLFKPSLCCREAQNYLIVKSLGIPCPDVLAVGDERLCCILTETFIVTTFLKDTKDGRIFMKNGEYATGHQELLRLFCETHLEWLARLHDAGYYHKTFHARNLMFRENPDQQPEFFWIDMARMHKFTAHKCQEIEHDLGELFGDLLLPHNEENSLREFYWSKRKTK